MNTKNVLIKQIQDNLNVTSCRQDERFLLNTSNQFRQLLKYHLLEYNDAIGAFYNGYWLNEINGENWMLKISKQSGISKRLYHEIIGEKMARVYGANVITSQIFKYTSNSNTYCIMSKNYKTDAYYAISGREIVTAYLEHLEQENYFKNVYGISSYLDFEQNIFNPNSLKIIKDALQYYFKTFLITFPNNKDKVLATVDTIFQELKIRYIQSYLTLQSDFHLGNFEILYNGRNAFLSPIYDVEMCLDSKRFYNQAKNTSMHCSFDGSLNSDEDFALFLQDTYNQRLARRLHYVLNPKDLLFLMSPKNETDLVIPDDIQQEAFQDFSEHYSHVEKLIENPQSLKKTR